MKPSRSRRRGFTLVEILLVLVILVIIVSLVTTNIVTAQRRAYKKAAEAAVGMLDSPLQMYYISMTEFPSTDQGLEALRNPPAGLTNPENWDGPYLHKNVPVDPWGNEYLYKCPGQNNPDSYDLWSMGPDKTDGTDDDIVNW